MPYHGLHPPQRGSHSQAGLLLICRMSGGEIDSLVVFWEVSCYCNVLLWLGLVALWQARSVPRQSRKENYYSEKSRSFITSCFYVLSLAYAQALSFPL